MSSLTDYQFLLNLINRRDSEGTIGKILRQWFEMIGAKRTLTVVDSYLQHFSQRTPHKVLSVLVNLPDDSLRTLQKKSVLVDWVLTDRKLNLHFDPTDFFIHTRYDFLPGTATLRTALKWIKEHGMVEVAFFPRLLFFLRTHPLNYHAFLQLAKDMSDFPTPENWTKRRIAILSDTTTQQLVMLLKAGLFFQQISAEIRGGDFQQFDEIVLDPASWLYDFQPDMIILISSSLASPFGKEVDWVRQRVHFIHQLHKRLDITVIVTNFEPTPESGGVAGIPDWIYDANVLLRSELPEHTYVFDLSALVSECGLDRWVNLNYWNLSRQACDLHLLPKLILNLSAFIRAIIEPLVKVLVSDLDNTLWGGLVAEVGVEGIRIGGNDVGESHLRYQVFLKEQIKKGFLLAVCSKNKDNIARLPFLNNPAMYLALEDIACFQASFNPKTMMLQEIANKLNLNLHNFLMIDDSSHERQEIREYCPEVQVIPWPDDGIAGIPRWLNRSGLVARPYVTDEDKMRNYLYQQQQAREIAQTTYSSKEEFLSSLSLIAHIRPIIPANMDRVMQLIEKTNQFNVTNRRHSRKDVETLLSLPHSYGHVLYLEDKYGPYGLTGVLIAVPQREDMWIDTFILSCRIMGKTVETAFVDHLVQFTKTHGITALVGCYHPTEKNQSVASLYFDLGFQQIGTRGDDVLYRFAPLSTYVPHNRCIHITGDYSDKEKHDGTKEG